MIRGRELSKKFSACQTLSNSFCTAIKIYMPLEKAAFMQYSYIYVNVFKHAKFWTIFSAPKPILVRMKPNPPIQVAWQQTSSNSASAAIKDQTKDNQNKP